MRSDSSEVRVGTCWRSAIVARSTTDALTANVPTITTNGGSASDDGWAASDDGITTDDAAAIDDGTTTDDVIAVDDAAAWNDATTDDAGRLPVAIDAVPLVNGSRLSRTAARIPTRTTHALTTCGCLSEQGSVISWTSYILLSKVQDATDC